MTLAKIHEILNFINAIKGSYSFEIEDTFLNGFCYWFAKILELRFNGVIYFNPKQIHFATLIDEQLFDVTGLINVDENWYHWEDYMATHDIEYIYHSCILKDNNTNA